jgi:hypothetical protein
VLLDDLAALERREVDLVVRVDEVAAQPFAPRLVGQAGVDLGSVLGAGGEWLELLRMLASGGREQAGVRQELE